MPTNYRDDYELDDEEGIYNSNVWNARVVKAVKTGGNVDAIIAEWRMMDPESYKHSVYFGNYAPVRPQEGASLIAARNLLQSHGGDIRAAISEINGLNLAPKERTEITLALGQAAHDQRTEPAREAYNQSKRPFQPLGQSEEPATSSAFALLNNESRGAFTNRETGEHLYARTKGKQSGASIEAVFSAAAGNVTTGMGDDWRVEKPKQGVTPWKMAKALQQSGMADPSLLRDKASGEYLPIETSPIQKRDQYGTPIKRATGNVFKVAVADRKLPEGQAAELGSGLEAVQLSTKFLPGIAPKDVNNLDVIGRRQQYTLSRAAGSKVFDTGDWERTRATVLGESKAGQFGAAGTSIAVEQTIDTAGTVRVGLGIGDKAYVAGRNPTEAYGVKASTGARFVMDPFSVKNPIADMESIVAHRILAQGGKAYLERMGMGHLWNDETKTVEWGDLQQEDKLGLRPFQRLALDALHDPTGWEGGKVGEGAFTADRISSVTREGAWAWGKPRFGPEFAGRIKELDPDLYKRMMLQSTKRQETYGEVLNLGFANAGVDGVKPNSKTVEVTPELASKWNTGAEKGKEAEDVNWDDMLGSMAESRKGENASQAMHMKVMYRGKERDIYLPSIRNLKYFSGQQWRKDMHGLAGEDEDIGEAMAGMGRDISSYTASALRLIATRGYGAEPDDSLLDSFFSAQATMVAAREVNRNATSYSVRNSWGGTIGGDDQIERNTIVLGDEALREMFPEANSDEKLAAVKRLINSEDVLSFAKREPNQMNAQMMVGARLRTSDYYPDLTIKDNKYRAMVHPETIAFLGGDLDGDSITALLRGVVKFSDDGKTAYYHGAKQATTDKEFEEARAFLDERTRGVDAPGLGSAEKIKAQTDADKLRDKFGGSVLKFYEQAIYGQGTWGTVSAEQLQTDAYALKMKSGESMGKAYNTVRQLIALSGGDDSYAQLFAPIYQKAIDMTDPSKGAERAMSLLHGYQPATGFVRPTDANAAPKSVTGGRDKLPGAAANSIAMKQFISGLMLSEEIGNKDFLASLLVKNKEQATLLAEAARGGDVSQVMRPIFGDNLWQNAGQFGPLTQLFRASASARWEHKLEANANRKGMQQMGAEDKAWAEMGRALQAGVNVESGRFGPGAEVKEGGGLENLEEVARTVLGSYEDAAYSPQMGSAMGRVVDPMLGITGPVKSHNVQDMLAKILGGDFSVSKKRDDFPVIAFASGGAFQVGGQGGTDSQEVRFMASPDETVVVMTPEQKKKLGGMFPDMMETVRGLSSGKIKKFARGSGRVAEAMGGPPIYNLPVSLPGTPMGGLPPGEAIKAEHDEALWFRTMQWLPGHPELASASQAEQMAAKRAEEDAKHEQGLKEFAAQKAAGIPFGDKRLNEAIRRAQEPGRSMGGGGTRPPAPPGFMPDDEEPRKGSPSPKSKDVGRTLEDVSEAFKSVTEHATKLQGQFKKLVDSSDKLNAGQEKRAETIDKVARGYESIAAVYDKAQNTPGGLWEQEGTKGWAALQKADRKKALLDKISGGLEEGGPAEGEADKGSPMERLARGQAVIGGMQMLYMNRLDKMFMEPALKGTFNLGADESRQAATLASLGQGFQSTDAMKATANWSVMQQQGQKQMGATWTPFVNDAANLMSNPALAAAGSILSPGLGAGLMATFGIGQAANFTGNATLGALAAPIGVGIAAAGAGAGLMSRSKYLEDNPEFAQIDAYKSSKEGGLSYNANFVMKQLGDRLRTMWKDPSKIFDASDTLEAGAEKYDAAAAKGGELSALVAGGLTKEKLAGLTPGGRQAAMSEMIYGDQGLMKKYAISDEKLASQIGDWSVRYGMDTKQAAEWGMGGVNVDQLSARGAQLYGGAILGGANYYKGMTSDQIQQVGMFEESAFGQAFIGSGQATDNFALAAHQLPGMKALPSIGPAGAAPYIAQLGATPGDPTPTGNQFTDKFTEAAAKYQALSDPVSRLQANQLGSQIASAQRGSFASGLNIDQKGLDKALELAVSTNGADRAKGAEILRRISGQQAAASRFENIFSGVYGEGGAEKANTAMAAYGSNVGAANFGASFMQAAAGGSPNQFSLAMSQPGMSYTSSTLGGTMSGANLMTRQIGGATGFAGLEIGRTSIGMSAAMGGVNVNGMFVNPNFAGIAAASGGAANNAMLGTYTPMGVKGGWMAPSINVGGQEQKWGQDIGGLLGLQAEASDISYQSTLASAGISAGNVRRAQAFTQGGPNLAKYGNYYAGKELPWSPGKMGEANFGERGFWQIEDDQEKLQREQKRWSFEQSGKNKDLQIRQFMEGFDFNRNVANTQRNWQIQDFGFQKSQTQRARGYEMEDYSFQRGQSAVHFGWQMEDADENIRYATGRDRRLLERQRKRTTIDHNTEEGRAETMQKREVDKWKVEDQRFEVEKKRAGETFKIQIERADMEKRHFLERMALDEEARKKQGEWMEQQFALEDEMKERQRTFWDLNQESQLAAIGSSVHYATLSKQNSDKQLQIQATQSAINGQVAWLFDAEYAFVTTLVDHLRGISMALASGNLGSYSPAKGGLQAPAPTTGQSVKAEASGGTFYASSPSMMLVGDEGGELVSVTPSQSSLPNFGRSRGAGLGGGGNNQNIEVSLLLDGKVLAAHTVKVVNGEVARGRRL